MPRELQMKIWKSSTLPSDWPEKMRILNRKTAEPIEEDTKTIIDEVKTHGDFALVEFARKFDKALIGAKDLRVTAKETEEAYEKVKEEQISALKFAKDNVESIERLALKRTRIEINRNCIQVQYLTRPIQSVGCYVPGGEAIYPSTLIMTVVPAKVAGVPRIVVCSPPSPEGTVNPLTLVAADICNVDEIYKVGGAQAIAALAYGTETIKTVRKIVGPGNKYVTMAKILVSKDVAIDVPAGPSEVVILADDTANPRFVALDMISQAEHSIDSVAGLITTSKVLAEKVLRELETIVATTNRKAIIKEALSKYGFIIVCRNADEMTDLTNLFAPEHLEIMTCEPSALANAIVSAGVILLGPYSPVSLSDYGSGTNHVLPTSGFGHVFSGLSVLDYVRRVGVVEGSKEGLSKLRNHVKVLAETENLPNHYKALEGRLEVESSK